MSKLNVTRVFANTDERWEKSDEGYEFRVLMNFVTAEVDGEDEQGTYTDYYHHKYQPQDATEAFRSLYDSVSKKMVINTEHWYEGERQRHGVTPYWATAEFAHRERAGIL